MFYIKILIIVLPIVILILVYDYLKDYKKNHWYVKCSHCGYTDTEYKQNNIVREHYDEQIRLPVKYTEKGIPTYICKHCEKEYNMSEGEWVKKPVLPVKEEIAENN